MNIVSTYALLDELIRQRFKSLEEAAHLSGIEVRKLHQILDGEFRIDAATAIRLAGLTGTTDEFWNRMQNLTDQGNSR
jgi:plasmid maintenance system antidote protein VapI